MRARENDVASLHGKLNNLYTRTAETLLEALESSDEETRLMAINLTSPSMLTSMANWVKQNNVTCQPEEVQEVDDFANKLQNKRREARAKRLQFTRLADISTDEVADG